MKKKENKKPLTTTKLFKNKFQMILYIILFIIFLCCFIYFGTLDFTKESMPSNEMFNYEFSMVEKDNVFFYVNSSEATSLLKGNNVLLLIGDKNNEWVGYYAKILNEIAKEEKINKIYYYDISEDKDNQNATYKNMLQYLEVYTTYVESKETINTPTFIVKQDGAMVFYDIETSIVNGKISPDDYWTAYNINLKENTLRSVLSNYLNRGN